MPIEPGTLSLGVLAGGSIVAVWTHFLTKSRSSEERRIREFNEASAKLRAAFRDEFLALNPAHNKEVVDACDLLSAAFNKHRSAVFDFKPFLSKTEVEGFEKAWKKYYQYTNAQDGTIAFFEQYSGKGFGSEEVRKKKFLAAERIESILSFAHHK